MDATHQPEQWKPVVGYEGLYEVSDQGRVRSLDRPDGRGRKIKGLLRALTETGDPVGPKKKRYLQLGLSRNSVYRTRKVHVLVMAAFVGPRPAGLDICHRNGDPSDNRLSNLRYGTKRSNMLDRHEHGTYFKSPGRSKLSPNQVREIRERYALGGVSQRALAREHGLCQGTISHLLLHKNWRDIP